MSGDTVAVVVGVGDVGDSVLAALAVRGHRNLVLTRFDQDLGRCAERLRALVAGAPMVCVVGALQPDVCAAVRQLCATAREEGALALALLAGTRGALLIEDTAAANPALPPDLLGPDAVLVLPPVEPQAHARALPRGPATQLQVLALALVDVLENLLVHGYIGICSEDYREVLSGAGQVRLGVAEAVGGEGAARRAVEAALQSPWLQGANVAQAGRLLLAAAMGAKGNLLALHEALDVLHARLPEEALLLFACREDAALPADGWRMTLLLGGRAPV